MLYSIRSQLLSSFRLLSQVVDRLVVVCTMVAKVGKFGKKAEGKQKTVANATTKHVSKRPASGGPTATGFHAKMNKLESVFQKPAAADSGDEQGDDSVMDTESQREIRAKKRILENEIDKAKAGQGTLPQHVIEMYNSAMALKTGRNKAIRDIALNAITQKDARKYEITINKPMFEEWRTKYEEKWGLEKGIGETETFMRQKTGGQANLDAAVASGEVDKLIDEATGRVFYKRHVYEAGKKLALATRQESEDPAP